jgi:hypothetical protein
MSEMETQVSPPVETTAPVESAAPAEPAEPISRRDAIEAAVKAKAAPADAPVTPAKPAEGTSAVVVEAKPADVRPRDDQGRFRALPKSWKQDLAPKFEQLDPDIQTEVHRRESDILRGIETYKSKAKMAEEFEHAMQPYMGTMQQLGVTPVAAVQALMGADHKLRFGSQQEKQAVVADIIRTYGVQFDPSQPLPQADPSTEHISRLEQEIRALKQSQEQATLAPFVQAVNKFRETHEHFDDLQTYMEALINSGAARDLEDAYDQALWAHPELRQQALSAQKAREAEEERKRVEAAKAAAVQVRGAPAQAMPRQPNPQDRRAMIQQAMAGLQR